VNVVELMEIMEGQVYLLSLVKILDRELIPYL